LGSKYHGNAVSKALDSTTHLGWIGFVGISLGGKGEKEGSYGMFHIYSTSIIV